MTRTRSNALWTFTITSLALFMVALDNLVVTTALPVIKTDLGASLQDLAVDRQRVHADVRGPAHHRRRPGRPVRSQARVPDRHGHLHRRFGPGRAVDVDRQPHPRPRHPGRRRRDRDAAHADDPVRGDAPGAPGRRARCVGWHRGSGHRHRSARRRRHRGGPRLALDLLAQRPDRPGRPADGRLPPDREPTARRAASTSPAWA